VSVVTTTIELRLERVDTFELQVFKDKVPYDLAGAQLQIVVKTERELGASAVITKTIGNGITVTDEAAGKFRLAIGVADKAGMSAGDQHFWETKLTLANGEPVTPDGLEGPVNIIPSIQAAA
jgi:hypothetical protein